MNISDFALMKVFAVMALLSFAAMMFRFAHDYYQRRKSIENKKILIGTVIPMYGTCGVCLKVAWTFAFLSSL